MHPVFKLPLYVEFIQLESILCVSASAWVSKTCRTGPGFPVLDEENRCSIWRPQQLLILHHFIPQDSIRKTRGWSLAPSSRRTVVLCLYWYFKKFVFRYESLVSDMSLWPKVGLSYREIFASGPIPERFVFELLHSTVSNRKHDQLGSHALHRLPPSQTGSWRSHHCHFRPIHN